MMLSRMLTCVVIVSLALASSARAQLLRQPLELVTPLGSKTFEVMSAEGTEAINEPYVFRVELRSGRSDIDPADLLGRPVAFSVELPGGDRRVFYGLCSAFERGRMEGTLAVYHATLVPRLWLLSLNRNARMFQDLSLPEIAQAILADHATSLSLELVGTHPPRELTVQYQESDLAFLLRRAEREGIRVYFRNGTGGTTVVMADNPVDHPDIADPATVRWDPAAEYLLSTVPVVHELTHTAQYQAGKVTLWDHDFERPALQLDTTITIDQPWPDDEQFELYEFPGGYTVRSDGIELARNRAEALAAGANVFAGESNLRHLAAGYAFTIERHAERSLDGRYLVTRVTHKYSRPDGERVEYHNQFTAIPDSVPYRPPRVTPIPRIAGLQSAVVTTAPRDKYGRIKVQFLWDRQDSSGKYVRVMQPPPGVAPPELLLPEAGDEVLVGFEHGDVDRPVILGKLYNGADMPPAGNFIRPGWEGYR